MDREYYSFILMIMEEMKHGESIMDKLPHMHNHEGPMGALKGMLWQNNWKSPVALGIFLATSMFGLVMLMYALNLAAAAVQAMRPEQQSQGLSQQQLQQMMQQQAPATSGASAGATQ